MDSQPVPDDPLLSALAEYWDEVLGLADEGQRDELTGLAAGTVEPDPVDARAALQDILLDLLPPGHPLARVLGTATMFDAGGGADYAVDFSRLRSRLTLGEPPGAAWPAPATPAVPPPDPAPVPGPAPQRRPVFPTPAPTDGDGDGSDAGAVVDGPGESTEPDWLDQLGQEVRERLLALASLSPAEVRGRGVDPDDSGLIRLRRPERGSQLPAFQLPAFQFQPVGGGPPWPVVTRVNRLLDARTDPWGVTCWWVDPHARMAAAPADLLGTGQDDLLLWTAAQIGAD